LSQYRQFPERFTATQVDERILGLGRMSRARYYWRQADICMRLSLLSDDGEITELLINKAMELMSQAETAAGEEGVMSGGRPTDGDGSPDSSGEHH
jgi:hypothetical protein